MHYYQLQFFFSEIFFLLVQVMLANSPALSLYKMSSSPVTPSIDNNAHAIAIKYLLLNSLAFTILTL